jgi:site-specific DNA-methyltransferase (adenine-specific)
MINKIIQGDCLEVMKEIPDKSIDMILCDLPYGTTACKWDTIIPFEPLWEQYKRIIKDNGAIILTASQPFTSALVMSNIKMFRYEVIWEKERPTNIFFMKKQIGKVHENIVVFYKKQPTYNPIMEKRNANSGLSGETDYSKFKNNGSLTHPKQKYQASKTYDFQKKYPRSIQYFKRDLQSNKERHPTQKPVALFEYLIKTYTNEGDLVLDNCAGSGTTGVACKNLNRNFILIEKDPEYCKIAQERLDGLSTCNKLE